MLDQIRYLGYVLKESTFKNQEVVSEGGFINLSSTLRDEVEGYIDEDKDHLFTLTVDAMLQGMDKDKVTVVFQCEQTLQLEFVCFDGPSKNTEDDIKKCVQDESWFFQNFVDLAVKTSVEKTLSDTSFENISIPPFSRRSSES
ncbi:hypothetical protein DN730_09945 [Marinomonas piezotolerans]|uniref:Uncharacterized protein n=1 Tax=Marinomonas piezotolerans TaxID=2213058 RepID=A0A370UAA6_9GAMM|nr:hypothetical protein [Marinomonas piezotolerans]RDL44695.1 hypothetical protein DN730_09945 [Marinomonas piezotolerans]